MSPKIPATPIWQQPATPEQFVEHHRETLPGLLGIVLVEIGADFVRAEMPVDRRHIQPHGILHGGGSVVLAETVGSFCGAMAVAAGQTCVGVEISASHLAPVHDGDRVTALCRPLRVGRSLQVWQIDIRRQDGTLTCQCRLTTAARARHSERVAAARETR